MVKGYSEKRRVGPLNVRPQDRMKVTDWVNSFSG